jgi:hypothetical protein
MRMWRRPTTRCIGCSSGGEVRKQPQAAPPPHSQLGACLSNARLLRPTRSGGFLRSFPLHRTPLCAGNDRRNPLAGGRPRYGDHYSDRLLGSKRWIRALRCAVPAARKPGAYILYARATHASNRARPSGPSVPDYSPAFAGVWALFPSKAEATRRARDEFIGPPPAPRCPKLPVR